MNDLVSTELVTKFTTVQGL